MMFPHCGTKDDRFFDILMSAKSFIEYAKMGIVDKQYSSYEEVIIFQRQRFSIRKEQRTCPRLYTGE
mgnify:CR=1 FL=1|jgi:hypothetical protein